jgi:enoyl-CoA hydratase/carnithine racemase
MPVDLTIEGAVAKVVLNRPDKLNALTVDMRQSLCDYFAHCGSTTRCASSS